MFLDAILPSNDTWFTPVNALIVYEPSGPISAVRIGTLRPELFPLKRIVPPSAGLPLTETIPLTVAFVQRLIDPRFAVAATRRRARHEEGNHDNAAQPRIQSRHSHCSGSV